jgi:large subunit ribosomal protein L24
MEKKNKVTKVHVRKGDTVIVIAGDAKGKEGKVTKVLISESKAIVEGLNMVKRHLKPTATKPQGSIVEKEAPIHVSNLQLKDPKNGKPTKVGKKLDSNKKLVRYSKKTGEVIKNG